MRSLFRLLGIEPAGRESDDTATVRRLAAELDRLPEPEARYLAAFAYVLARVAHADLEISEEEVRAMEEQLRETGGLGESQAALVVQMAKHQTVTLGGTENYIVTRQFREMSTREQRIGLLRCLFEVAAADEHVSDIENSQISQIATELGLTTQEVAAVRSAYRDHLGVLKGMPRR